MEEGKTSCLMVAAELVTPVSLSSVFDGGEIVPDSHVTILYKKNVAWQRDEVVQALGDKINILDTVNRDVNEDEYIPVLSIFDLDVFNNEYLVLRMKNDNVWYQVFSEVNKETGKALRGDESEFKTYNPHLTLARFTPGEANEYLTSESLHAVLRDSVVRFEDFIYSVGDIGVDDYLTYNITTKYAVPRFFRLREKDK